jgi:hypothetical protein
LNTSGTFGEDYPGVEKCLEGERYVSRIILKDLVDLGKQGTLLKALSDGTIGGLLGETYLIKTLILNKCIII